MNKRETLQILKIISSVHGGTEPDELKVTIWQEILKEPYEMVLQAVLELLRTNRYPPKPADIIEQMKKDAFPDQIDGADAWDMVHNAYMSLYDEDRQNAEEIHRQLPIEIRRLIMPQDLIDFAFHMRSTDILSYERPRFIKAFDEIQQRETMKAISRTPVNVLKDQESAKLSVPDLDLLTG